MTRWIEPQPVDVPAALREAVGGHPLVAETLARRGMVHPEVARAFLDPAVYRPAPPTDLPGLAAAAGRLRQTIGTGEKTAIWGDFDVDGQTATALLLETLRGMGAHVTFRVPTRDEGHGLHIAGMDRLIDDGVRLVVTCDTGITAHAAVEHARERGTDVIITDHHVPGDHLPRSLAVVNPHLLPIALGTLHPGAEQRPKGAQAGPPMGALTGVGVAYELARALDPALADLTLDLVALGTVADVATLIGDARYLVQHGLEALRHTRRLGLQAVYEAAGLRPEGITEEHIGFVLGPRLNALGRLADAAHGVELLTTDDWARARILAAEAEGLNGRRQWLTKQVTDAALAQIEREPALLSDYHVLLLSHPTWPTGIIGPVAGRLAERFGKPAVLIAAPAGALARGSCRSVPGVDFIAALSDCSHLLDGFGGHAGAAGFGIEAERIPELRATLSRAIAARTEALPEPAITIDSYVEFSELTLDLVNHLNRLAPFGPGNPPLTLAVRDVHVVGDATIGRTAEHRRITVEDAAERTQTAFWWQGAGWPLPQGRFDLAFAARASDYRGMAEIQVEWIDAREQEAAIIEAPPAPGIEVVDQRTAINPEAALARLASSGDLLVWAEVKAPTGVDSRTRLQLARLDRPQAGQAGHRKGSGIPQRLAIWTLPPGPQELRSVLEEIQPREVALFAQDPGMDQVSTFLPRLAGVAKFALQAREGELDLEEAAAATAQRVSAVQAGLDRLAARGQLRIVARDRERWHILAGTGDVDGNALEIAGNRLEGLLAETAAYRDYVRQAPAATLVSSALR